MNEEYMGYRLINVYNNVDSSLKNEIIALWTDNRAIPPDEAERRVQEVVYIIRNPEGIIAGVSTVYLQKFMDGEHPFYFMRMFIRPEDRGHLGLPRVVSRKTREFLKTYKRPECRPKGVIIIIENPKYLGKGNKKSLEERGWTYYGQGPLGNHIWYEFFDGSLLTKMNESVSMNDICYTISARSKTEDVPVMEYLKENFNGIPLNQVDSLFGFVERCTLYGGRPFVGRQLSDADVFAMYRHSMGVRIPLTNLFVTEDEYKQYNWLFDKYHRIGNSIISTDDNLARWIRRDYPNYQLEASVIKNIDSYEKINESLDLYDTVILPMSLNLHYDFLDKIANKQRITLFANSGCAFNCHVKICYKAVSAMNKFTGTTKFRCSKATMPREELGIVDFDLKKLSSMGFKRFKLLRAKPGGITAF